MSIVHLEVYQLISIVFRERLLVMVGDMCTGRSFRKCNTRWVFDYMVLLEICDAPC
jgi:hypothetical protein